MKLTAGFLSMSVLLLALGILLPSLERAEHSASPRGIARQLIDCDMGTVEPVGIRYVTVPITNDTKHVWDQLFGVASCGCVQVVAVPSPVGAGRAVDVQLRVDLMYLASMESRSFAETVTIYSGATTRAVARIRVFGLLASASRFCPPEAVINTPESGGFATGWAALELPVAEASLLDPPRLSVLGKGASVALSVIPLRAVFVPPLFEFATDRVVCFPIAIGVHMPPTTAPSTCSVVLDRGPTLSIRLNPVATIACSPATIIAKRAEGLYRWNDSFTLRLARGHPRKVSFGTTGRGQLEYNQKNGLLRLSGTAATLPEGATLTLQADGHPIDITVQIESHGHE